MVKVLITGGEGDIAGAIAELLRRSGQYEVKTPGKRELDVTDIESVARYVDAWFPDILINNAGYVIPQSIYDCDVNGEKRSLDINLFGTFNCTAAVLKRNDKAQIINIGSSAATKAHGTWASYCAAKAAVVMATKCWAELGVNCICISPGRTATKMRKALYPEEDRTTLMDPADFARIVLYALQGKYKNGSNIDVNVGNVKELIECEEQDVSQNDNRQTGKTIF